MNKGAFPAHSSACDVSDDLFQLTLQRVESDTPTTATETQKDTANGKRESNAGDAVPNVSIDESPYRTFRLVSDLLEELGTIIFEPKIKSSDDFTYTSDETFSLSKLDPGSLVKQGGISPDTSKDLTTLNSANISDRHDTCIFATNIKTTKIWHSYLHKNAGIIAQKLHSISDGIDLPVENLLAIIDEFDFPNKSFAKKYVDLDNKAKNILKYQSKILVPPEYPMYVMKASDFVNLPDVKMPHHEDLMRRGLLYKVVEDEMFRGCFSVNLEGVFEGASCTSSGFVHNRSHFITISHQWLTPNRHDWKKAHPDNEFNEKFISIKEFVKSTYPNHFIWMDYLSIPQELPENRGDQIKALNSLTNYFYISSRSIISCLTMDGFRDMKLGYLSRGFCLTELCTMHLPRRDIYGKWYTPGYEEFGQWGKFEILSASRSTASMLEHLLDLFGLSLSPDSNHKSDEQLCEEGVGAILKSNRLNTEETAICLKFQTASEKIKYIYMIQEGNPVEFHSKTLTWADFLSAGHPLQGDADEKFTNSGDREYLVPLLRNYFVSYYLFYHQFLLPIRSCGSWEDVEQIPQSYFVQTSNASPEHLLGRCLTPKEWVDSCIPEEYIRMLGDFPEMSDVKHSLDVLIRDDSTSLLSVARDSTQTFKSANIDTIKYAIAFALDMHYFLVDLKLPNPSSPPSNMQTHLEGYVALFKDQLLQKYFTNECVSARSLLFKEITEVFKSMLDEIIDISKQELKGRNDADAFETAQCLYEEGNIEEAKALFQSAILDKEKTLGSLHIETLRTVNHVAEFYDEQEDYEEAKVLYLRAIEGFEKNIFSHHVEAHLATNNLAALHYDQGNYEEAKMLYQRALQGLENSVGPHNKSTLSTVYNFALLLNKQGDLEQAKGLFRRALVGYETSLGLNNIDALRAVNYLAAMHAEQEDYEEAKLLCQRAIEGFEKTLGRDHIDTIESINLMSAINRTPLWNSTISEFPDTATIKQHSCVIIKRICDYSGKLYNCDVCGESGIGWAYSCLECDFDVHPTCATGRIRK